MTRSPRAPSLRRCATSPRSRSSKPIRTGPGNMPRFTGNLSDKQVDDIVKYVTTEIQHPNNPGGFGLGGLGPVAEGFVGLLVGVGVLVLVCLLDRGALVSDQHEHRTPVDTGRLRGERPAPPARGEEPRNGRARHRRYASSLGTRWRGRLRRLRTGSTRKPWILGATMGGGFFFLGVGLVAWGKYLMPRGPFVEERHELANVQGRPRRLRRGHRGARRRRRQASQDARRAPRRGLGIFGVVAMFPLLRSLGPLPKGTLFHTDWRKGSYAVDQTRASRQGRRPRGRLDRHGLSRRHREHRPRSGRRPDRADPTLERGLHDAEGSRDLGAARATSRTPSSAPTSGARWASTSSSSSCSCVRATSRCSTSPTVPCPSSVRRRDRCPSCRSTSTRRATSARQSGLRRARRSGILGALNV